MDTDEPDFPPAGTVKGVLQIPSMTVINSAATEENTKGQRSGHQRRENINAKSTRIIERRGGGGANRKSYRKDGESSSSRNAKNKDGIRTKGCSYGKSVENFLIDYFRGHIDITTARRLQNFYVTQTFAS
jgi:hypothetical protein